MSVIDPGIFPKGWLDKKIPGGPSGYERKITRF
jgi:hypothetical protein